MADMVRRNVDIDLQHQQAIVGELNHIFDNLNDRNNRVRIMHLNGEMWVCLRFKDLVLEGYTDLLQPNQKDKVEIEKWLPDVQKPVRRFRNEEFEMPKERHNQFLYVLANAVCCACQHAAKSFRKAVGDDEETTVIRNVIAELITTGELPRGEAEEIWANL